MKLKQIKYFIGGLLLLGCSATAFAQQANTVYFMRGIPERNAYNPAFQPENNVYIDLPVMPNFKLGLGNNSLSLNDIVFNKDGRTMTFLDQAAFGAERDNFYNALRGTTQLGADFSLNIIGFGFRVKKNYFTFDISEKMNGGLYLPKDLFSLALYGTEKSNKLDLSKFGVQASLYTEVGLGFSRQINDKLTVGTKLKLLLGQANINTDIDNFKLIANQNEWTIRGKGAINASIPLTNIPLKIDDDGTQVVDFDNIKSQENLTTSDYTALLSSNIGFGIDLGATYQLLPNLQVSAALTDLGFIKWKKNLTNLAVNDGYSFKGVEYSLDENTEGEVVSLGDRFDNQLDSLSNAFKFVGSNKAYTSYLSARLNVGAEYSIVNDKIGFGLLSSTLFVDKTAFTDLTASVNFRPAKWFNPSFSYSLINGEWSSIGFGAQLKVGIFNMYLAVDQIPLRFNKTTDNLLIPSHLKSTTVQAGMVWAFGGKKQDDDRDGVKNKKDKCPNTPLGVLVDKYGCPLDNDFDGVPDYLDMCPNTPTGVAVDVNGCPFDTDGDGVLDYLDQCPNTPEGVAVDANGCPFDTDGDGVPDYLDACPTVQGSAANNGCPEPEPELAPVPVLVPAPVVEEKAEEVVEVRQEFTKTLNGITFQTDKATIKKAFYPALNKIVTVMEENPSYFLTISGHTDNIGKPASNQVLSENRAGAVKEYLINHGMKPSRLTSSGFGDTRPVGSNKTAAGRAKNRRVDFEVKFETVELKTVK